MGKEANTQSTLIRGIAILEKVVKLDRPVSSAFLAEDLDLPKATVHRIACQLENEGLLQREPDGKRFTGGTRLRTLAISTLSNSVITANRHAILKTLSEEINETCNLVALNGNEIFYLDRIESNWPHRIHLPVGSNLPLHCTAAGKLFLAHMPPEVRERLICSTPLKRHTEKTITDEKDLEVHLNEIAGAGVSFDTGEYLEDMVAIAAPVIGEDGKMCFSIAIHAPSARRSLEELKQFLPNLRQTAALMAKTDCQGRHNSGQ